MFLYIRSSQRVNVICVNRFSLLSLSISGHTLSLYHVSMCQILSSCASEPSPHPLSPCSVIRKADPQWLHRRSTCPLPSVWVWPMKAGGRSLEAERRVRIRAMMFWLLIQSVTSWLPSTESWFGWELLSLGVGNCSFVCPVLLRDGTGSLLLTVHNPEPTFPGFSSPCLHLYRRYFY